MLPPAVGRVGVVVGVRHLVVLAALGFLVLPLVPVVHRGVVVLVAVVAGAMLERAEHFAGLVVVRHVVVVVRMGHCRVMVIVLLIADDALLGLALHDAPPCDRGSSTKLDAERMPPRGPFTTRRKRGISEGALVDDWRDLRPRGGRRRGLEREGSGLERLVAGDLRDGRAVCRARGHGNGRAGDEDGLARLYAGRPGLRH